MKPPSGSKKTNPNKPNFKPGDGFSAYYTRDSQGPEFTLSAAEGGLAMTFFGAFLKSVASKKGQSGTICLISFPAFFIAGKADLMYNTLAKYQ